MFVRRTNAPLSAALPVAALLVLGLAGCESDDAADGTTGDMSEPDVAASSDAEVPDAELPDAELPDIEVPDAEPPDPTAGSGTCEGTSFTTESGVAIIEDYGLQLQAVGAGSPTRVVVIEIRDDPDAPVELGGYDLEGSTLADCRICVLACDVVDGACTKRYLADEGVVNLTQRGSEIGDPIAFELHRVRFTEVTIEAERHTTVVPEGVTWCGDGISFEAELAAQPAMLGDTVRDFELQNCKTGEFQSVHDIGADVQALWFVATAGWCPACHAYLPQVFEAVAPIPKTRLEVIVVLGENQNYGQPTLEYCRQYVARYAGEDGSRFYLDHNGVSAFGTMFSSMWPYVGGRGEFGLPWNAVLAGGTYRYEYADGADGARGGVVDAVNRLLSQ